MTPAGHIAISYLTGRTFKQLHLPAIIIGGWLPDLDFLLLPFSGFNQWHRTLTHNLLFLGLAACLSLVSRHTRYSRVFLSLLLGGVLHLFFDSCLDTNPSNGIGVALFWPFSAQYFSPFNLLSPAANHLNWMTPLAFIRSSWPVIFVELPLWGIAAGVYWRSYRHIIPTYDFWLKKVAKK